jgi:hypothetical protein
MAFLFMRKAFNFYKSYYDVFMHLKSDKDKVAFMEALLNKQFLGIDPKLEGMAHFAYVSQQEIINQQVKGWLEKTGNTFPTPSVGGLDCPEYGEYCTPSLQEKEKGKEEEKEKVQPTLSEVEDYFDTNGYTIQAANKFYNYYSVANWKDSKGRQVKNWKQKAQSVWFRDEYLKPKAGKLPNDFCV